MLKNIILIPLFFLLCCNAYSQSFYEVIGDSTSSADAPWGVLNCTDGGYMMYGRFMDPFNQDVMSFCKVDSEGNLLWHHFSNLSGVIITAQQTSTGGFFLIGNSSYDNDYQVFVTKTDAGGNILWYKEYSLSYGTTHDVTSSAICINDGLIIGINFDDPSFSGLGHEICILRLDSSGNIKWNNTFNSGYKQDYITNLAMAPDSSLYIAGEDGDSNNTLTKMDQQGNIHWIIEYSNLGFRDMNVISSKELIISGNFASGLGSPNNMGVIKFDSSGNILESHFYRSDSMGLGLVHFISLGNKGYQLFGVGTVPGSATYSAYPFKLNIDNNWNINKATLYTDTTLDMAYNSASTYNKPGLLGAFFKQATNGNDNWVIMRDDDKNELCIASPFQVDTSHFDFTAIYRLFPGINTLSFSVSTYAYTSPDKFSAYAACKLFTTVKSPLSGNDVSIYPNPASDVFNINSSSPANTVTITDALGRMVYNKTSLKAIDEHYAITTTGFASGLYTIQIINQDGIVTKKIIINR